MLACGARVVVRRQLAVLAMVPVARQGVSPDSPEMVTETSGVVLSESLPVVPAELRSVMPLSHREEMPEASSACQGSGPNRVDLAAHD